MKPCLPPKACFNSSSGGSWSCVALESSPQESFEQEARALLLAYDSLCEASEYPFFVRFHLSDITRQQKKLELLVEELWQEKKPAFISYVGQPPASGVRLSLESWLFQGGKASASRSFGWGFGAYECFFSRLEELEPRGLGQSHGQTTCEFEGLVAELQKGGQSLLSDVQRTWLYCRDVDNNYAGLVEARNQIFAREGLTAETHYIASTGIEGRHQSPERLVFMDSLVITGLKEEQKEYMKALKFLSETHDYGVAFERGIRLLFGDMSLYFISGTASIDARGQVVHLGDVALQTERTLLNMQALMESHGGRLADLKLLTVYLRDRADKRIVEKVLAKSALRDCPYVMVEAPVCRPDWLIEIEAVGMNTVGLAGQAPLLRVLT